jgi:hypothetical protein
MDFFKSILPDFKTLLPARKRNLKIEILKLIDQACCEEAAFSSSPYSVESPVCIMSRPAVDDSRTATCETEPTQMFLQTSYGDNFT